MQHLLQYPGHYEIGDWNLFSIKCLARVKLESASGRWDCVKSVDMVAACHRVRFTRPVRTVGISKMLRVHAMLAAGLLGLRALRARRRRAE